MRHHAVERGKIVEAVAPGTGLAASKADNGTTPLGKQVGSSEPRPRPHGLDLDFRIVAEPGSRWGRQPEVDGVAVVLGRETQLETDRPDPPRALDRLGTAAHFGAELFGAGPER